MERLLGNGISGSYLYYWPEGSKRKDEKSIKEGSVRQWKSLDGPGGIL
jgi:hypothetical protein